MRARLADSEKKLPALGRAGEEFFQVLLHAYHGSRGLTVPSFCPTTVLFSGFGAVLGLVDGAQLRKAAFSLFRPEPTQYVSHLVYPTPLAFDMPVDHLQRCLEPPAPAEGGPVPPSEMIRRNWLPSRPRL